MLVGQSDLSSTSRTECEGETGRVEGLDSLWRVGRRMAGRRAGRCALGGANGCKAGRSVETVGSRVGVGLARACVGRAGMHRAGRMVRQVVDRVGLKS